MKRLFFDNNYFRRIFRTEEIIQEKLGLSPKDLILIELLTNPNAFQSTQQERRVLPEFNQR